MQSNENKMASPTANTSQRPTLLTILCILTFIATGVVVLATIIGFLATVFASLGATFLDRFAMDANAFSANLIIAIPTFCLTLIKCYGALQMWQLKKIGFFIYVITELALFVGIPILNSIALGLPFQITLLSTLFTALFIGLYCVNLKSLQ